MAAVVTFDASGPYRIIEISAGGADNELDWLEVYSEWKVWAATGDNLKHPPAFRVVGGDAISGVQDLGSTFFMLAPWKLRPSEESHRLVLNGNVFADPAGESVIVPTLGAHTVLVETFVSNLVDASVARLDLAQLLNAIYLDTVNGDDAGQGTNTAPVKTMARAFQVAAENNLTSLTFRGDIVLDRDAEGWMFTGASELASGIDLNGYSVDGSSFMRCALQGTMTGRVEANSCRLDIIIGLDGIFRDCGVSGTFAVAANGDLVLQRCFSDVPGTDAPICVLGANSQMSFRNWSGGLEIQQCTAGCAVSVDLDPGRLVLGSTNTGGTLVVRGGTEVADTSTGTTVISDGLVLAPSIELIRKLEGNRQEVDIDAQEFVLYDDDGTTVLQRWPLATHGGESVKTASGVQTKRGAPLL